MGLITLHGHDKNDRRFGWLLAISFVLLLFLVELPILSVPLPPLVDYPNHLARMHLIINGGDTFWNIVWSPLPNLAEDIVVPFLCHFMNLELSSRIFLGITLAISSVGVVLLGRAAHGTWRFWPLLGFLFLWNRSFLWGFLNYSFGIGVALTGSAIWLILEPSPRFRLLTSIPIALICWLAHIEAFVVYLLIVAGLELTPLFASLSAGALRSVISRIAFAVPQVIIPFGLSIAGWKAEASPAWTLSGFLRKADILFSVLDNYDRPFDVTCFFIVLSLFIWLSCTRRLGLALRFRPVLALLIIAYIIVPSHLFSGFGADHRFPAAIFLTLTASTSPRFRLRRQEIFVGSAFLAMLVGRVAVIEYVWLGANKIYALDLAIVGQIPANSAVAVAYSADLVNFTPIPELHMPLMATVRRDAFVPTLFAFPDQQPVSLSLRGATLAAGASAEGFWNAFVDRNSAALASMRPVLARYDDLLIVNRANQRPFKVLEDSELSLVAETPTFHLYEIIRPSDQNTGISSPRP